MPRIISTMEGDKVIFNIEIEPEIKDRNWCVVVSSKSNYTGGFEVPTISRILEYIYKVDIFCGKDSQIIKKEYLMPGEYLAVLGIGSKEMINTRLLDVIDETTTLYSPIITKFEIKGYFISDKDVASAKKLLDCMADLHDYNNKKGEKVFDNMMLEPMFSTIVEFLNNIVNKRDINLYTDIVKYRIVLQGPILKEGKYFWPIIRQGKYVEYSEY